MKVLKIYGQWNQEIDSRVTNNGSLIQTLLCIVLIMCLICLSSKRINL